MSLDNYDIVLHHITSHYVIHLIYAIPKIYNNQLLLQYHMYLLSIPCNNVYPSFIPCNSAQLRKRSIMFLDQLTTQDEWMLNNWKYICSKNFNQGIMSSR